MPVHRLIVQMRRRKSERTLIMDWNPHLRRLEPPVCEAGFSTRPIVQSFSFHEPHRAELDQPRPHWACVAGAGVARR